MGQLAFPYPMYVDVKLRSAQCIANPGLDVCRNIFAALRWLCASLGFIPVEEARVPLLESEDGSVYSDVLDDSASIASVSDAGTIRPNAHHHVDVGYSTSAESSFASLDPVEGGSGDVGWGEIGSSDSTDEENYVYLDGAVDGFWNF